MTKKIFLLLTIALTMFRTFSTNAYSLTSSDKTIINQIHDVILEKAEVKGQNWLNSIKKALPSAAEHIRDEKPRIAAIIDGITDKLLGETELTFNGPFVSKDTIQQSVLYLGEYNGELYGFSRNINNYDRIYPSNPTKPAPTNITIDNLNLISKIPFTFQDSTSHLASVMIKDGTVYFTYLKKFPSIKTQAIRMMSYEAKNNHLKMIFENKTANIEEGYYSIIDVQENILISNFISCYGCDGGGKSETKLWKLNSNNVYDGINTWNINKPIRNISISKNSSGGLEAIYTPGSIGNEDCDPIAEPFGCINGQRETIIWNNKTETLPLTFQK